MPRAARRPQVTQPDEPGQVVQLPARVTVNLPAKVWDALEESARLDGVSKTEVLRRAAWVYLFFMERVRSGGQIIVERPDGTSERVIFPY